MKEESIKYIKEDIKIKRIEVLTYQDQEQRQNQDNQY